MNYLIAIVFFNLTFFHHHFLQKPTPLNVGVSFNTIVFSPDGTRLLVSMDDSTAKILDAATGNVLRTLKGHKNKVNNASYSPDGKLIVTASEDKTAKIWNALTGEFMYELTEREYGISNAQFSPDGEKVLTVCPTAIKIWNAENGQYESKVDYSTGATGGIYTTACFSAKGRFVFTGSSDKYVKKWTIGYDSPLAIMKGHTNMVGSVCASPDGRFLISSGLMDQSVFIWDAMEGFLVSNIPGLSIANKVRCSADGKYFLAMGTTISVFRFPDFKQINEALFDEEELFFNDASFSPDGSKIVTISGYSKIKYWDVQTGKLLKVLN